MNNFLKLPLQPGWYKCWRWGYMKNDWEFEGVFWMKAKSKLFWPNETRYQRFELPEAPPVWSNASRVCSCPKEFIFTGAGNCPIHGNRKEPA